MWMVVVKSGQKGPIEIKTKPGFKQKCTPGPEVVGL
jgi:hypothetical protein